MATIAANKTVNVVTQLSNVKVGFLTKAFGNLEKNRFGIVPAVLIWSVCSASVAVGLGAMESAVLLSFLVVPTMAVLTFCLAVQPVKSIIWLAIVATIIDWSMIAFLALV